MRIYIQIHNSTTGNRVYTATAPDIDSAISELGRMERIITQGYSCIFCGEPIDNDNGYCNEHCSNSIGNTLEISPF